jgi:hypothetical protein
MSHAALALVQYEGLPNGVAAASERVWRSLAQSSLPPILTGECQIVH